MTHTVRVHFTNGDTITTSINGTLAEIYEYYTMGREFNLGIDGDNMQRVTGMEVLA